MKRSENRILTTHVGSIVRPQQLRDLAEEAQKSPENQKRYEDFLRDSVADVVRMQAKAGIDIVNDGEFGKSSWSNYILERITGFEHRPDQLRPVYWLGRDRDRFPEVMAAEFPWMSKGVADRSVHRTDQISRPHEYRSRYSQPEGRAEIGQRRRSVSSRRRSSELRVRRRQRILSHGKRVRVRHRGRPA